MWTELYQSIAHDVGYLHDRSSLAIRVRSTMFVLPGLWHDIGEAVTGPQLFDDDVLAMLECRCRKVHQELIDWMEDYKSHCVKTSLTAPSPEELAIRRELFGAALECLAIFKRLLATVCDNDREKLEVEIQALAHLLLDLQKQPTSNHSWLFSRHEVGMECASYITDELIADDNFRLLGTATSFILTKDHWDGSYSYESDYDRRIAIRIRYNTWSNTLRPVD